MKRFGFGGNKKKNKKILNIVKAIGGALCVLLLLFLVMDNFTLYWFMLFNNNNDAMERRQQGSEWYGDWASGNEYSPSNPSGSSGPSGGSNYGNTGMLGKAELEAMTPEEAVAAVTKTLTDEQIRDPETAWRVFIYLMDRHGFVPNAIIGAMSYVKAEGAGMGTFTYESYWLCPGPDGNKSSRHLGNQDWLDWLDGPGFKWAEANYAQRRANGKKLAYAAIGIGSVQSSDVWSGPGVKTTANATQMIQAANEKGLYWQDPGFQMPNLMSRYFVSSEPFGKGAWDVNDCPGVDPTADNQITADEWCCRVLCGVGMPAWHSDTVKTKHYDSYVSHSAGIEECSKLYDQYSKKDPWFYTERAVSSPVANPGDNTKQPWPCPSCGAKNSSESSWKCAFCGPEYDNSTYAGCTAARMALLLSSQTKQNANSIYGSFDNLSGKVDLQRHRYGITAMNAVYGGDSLYACCADFAREVVVMSGLDASFPARTTTSQERYMGASDKWRYLGTMSSNIGIDSDNGQTMTLQPGDILMVCYNSSDNYGEGSIAQFGENIGATRDLKDEIACGHVQVYTGTQTMSERFPGESKYICEASIGGGGSNGYYPRINVAWAHADGSVAEVRVWRCVKPDWNGTAWNSYYDTYHTQTWWDMLGRYPFTS